MLENLTIAIGSHSKTVYSLPSHTMGLVGSLSCQVHISSFSLPVTSSFILEEDLSVKKREMLANSMRYAVDSPYCVLDGMT